MHSFRKLPEIRWHNDVKSMFETKKETDTRKVSKRYKFTSEVVKTRTSYKIQWKYQQKILSMSSSEAFDNRRK